MKRFNFLSVMLAVVFVICSAHVVSAIGMNPIPNKIDGIDLDKIEEIFKKALDTLEGKGDPEAQYKLGVLFYRMLQSGGHPAVEEAHTNREAIAHAILFNHAQAEYWLKQSANQNYAPAQYLLGYMYYWDFIFTESNYAEAEKWYKAAAEQGHARAQAALADMYYVLMPKGESAELRRAKAFEWATKSAGHGDAYGMYVLSQIYSNKNFNVYNPTKAQEWEKKAEQAAKKDPTITFDDTDIDNK